jgi:hypothetical protein
MRKEREMKKAEEARGWGLFVGGPKPYLAWVISHYKKDVLHECVAPYHKAVRVVLITEREYHRLKRLDK